MKKTVLQLGLALMTALSLSTELGAQSFDRTSSNTEFEILEPIGWNLRLEDIAVGSREDDPRRLELWRFVRISIGIAEEFSFRIRDPRGLVDIKFIREAGDIFIQSPSNPSLKIHFAEIGEMNEGDTQDGPSGENVHWRLRFKIPNLKVARENAEGFEGYSIVLASEIESYISSSQPNNKCPGGIKGVNDLTQ